jgi:hypothetical protein
MAMTYFAYGSPGEPLDETLRSYGFLTLVPPSNLMDIGSLYFISADTRHFWPVCSADESDVKGMTKHSDSVELKVVDQSSGNLFASVGAQVMKLFGRSEGHKRTESFVLTGISIDEIALEDMGALYQKMMRKPECNRQASKYLRANGYVCQEQKILRATKFELARYADWWLSGEVEAAFGDKGLKTESDVRDSEQKFEKSRPDRDSVLTYGVAMSPLCMSPTNARFPRVLPNGAWDRASNSVLFGLVEPALEMLPARRQVEVANAPVEVTAEQ